MKGIQSMALALTILTTSAAQAGPTPELKCQAGKNQEAGKYAACIAKAEKGFLLKADVGKYAIALNKCATKLHSKWGKLETQAVAKGGACPSTSDLVSTQGLLDAAMAGAADTIAAIGTPAICSIGEACVGPTNYDILLQLDNAVTLGALQYEVDYSSAAGGFEGAGASVTCTNLVPAVIATSFNDIEGISTLVHAVIKGPPGFSGPGLPIASCRFVSSGQVPAATDFSIVFVDAGDPLGVPVPGVTVSIASISVTP